MDFGKLTVEYRSEKGKNGARRVRATGMVPGICYGAGTEPLPVALSAKALKAALDPQKRQNSVIQMTVTGAPAGTQELTVMLKDYDVDAIRQDVRHVDLVRVDLAKDVHVEVPVVIVGKSIGVTDGGQLHIVHRKLPVVCKPTLIPAKIEADVTALKIGDVLHIEDLKLPEGVRSALPKSDAVASVVAPQAEKAAAAPTEGEAAAAAGAAAAPAAADAKAAPAAKGGDAKAAPAKGDAKAPAKK